MSWEAGVLVLLAALLVAGFAWYERSRPPSQVVALVAALAALAVAGRLVLAPIPNVVATTDIVLFAGYALGSAPGFVVGALAAVVSNFWLGQGPWTPWQMAGWGMCGILGAGLAAASGRGLGRLPLALACAFAGFAYGALLDFSLMVTYGGEQSLDRFLAISARGVPFNIAHAAGNFVLALAAGPAMVRMLVRYRQRFEVRWRERPALARAAVPTTPLVALIAVALSIASASTATGDRASAAKAPGGAKAALAWLTSARNADGGFGIAPGSSSNPGMTGWAALGIEAGGRNPLDMRSPGGTPIAYLKRTASMIRTTGDLERTILVLSAAGTSPRRFAGRDRVSSLRNRRGADGSYGGQVNLTAFGILALRAARATAGNSQSAAWLRGVQNPDGGWGFTSGVASDADSTGAVLQALAAAGGGGDAGARGVDYLRRSQGAGGGFPLARGPVNAQSTAWAVQGLLAAGVDPSEVRKDGLSPFDYLRSVQARDGHYRYSTSSDQTPVWVTAQVLMAVNRAPFPLARVPRRKTSSGAGSSSASPGAAPGSALPAPPAGSKPSSDAPTTPNPAAAPATGEPPVAAPATPTASQGEEDDSGGPLLLVTGGIALAGAAVWGGWVLYRRRLP